MTVRQPGPGTGPPSPHERGPGGSPPASPQSGSGGGPLAAIALLTVLPVPQRARTPGRRVVLWLPLVGALVGALAGIPALTVWRGGVHGSPLLGAALTVTGLAALTRGLHLDGLADLADGLGSGRPAAEALAVMRRSDIGPFGVAVIVCTLLVQVTALSTVLAGSSRAAGLVAVCTAACTGRVAVVRAAGSDVPVAAGSSFGSLVAGTASGPARRTAGAALLCLAVLARLAVGGTVTQLVWSAAAPLVGLFGAAVLRRHAVRRLGGISGDVYGALVEVATTAVLLVLAAEAA